MKRCHAICNLPILPITNKKQKTIEITKDDIFCLSFLIDLSVADVESAYDMGNGLIKVQNTLERKYKFKASINEGLIESWFQHMPAQKCKDLVSVIFKLYFNKVEDPSDPRHVILVDIACIAYDEPFPIGTFGYIIKFAEYRKRF